MPSRGGPPDWISESGTVCLAKSVFEPVRLKLVASRFGDSTVEATAGVVEVDAAVAGRSAVAVGSGGGTIVVVTSPVLDAVEVGAELGVWSGRGGAANPGSGESMVDRPNRELGPIVQTGFAEQAGDVVLHRAIRQAEPLGDLPVRGTSAE
jgi:hypothetical protein